MTRQNTQVEANQQQHNWQEIYNDCVQNEFDFRATLLKIDASQDRKLIDVGYESLTHLIDLKDSIATRIAAEKANINIEDVTKRQEEMRDQMRGKIVEQPQEEKEPEKLQVT